MSFFYIGDEFAVLLLNELYLTMLKTSVTTLKHPVTAEEGGKKPLHLHSLNINQFLFQKFQSYIVRGVQKIYFQCNEIKLLIIQRHYKTQLFN